MSDKQPYGQVIRVARQRRLTARRLRERGWKMERIAKHMGITRQRVGQLLRMPPIK